MTTLDPQAFALGFFIVVGIGLILADLALTIRRRRTFERVQDKWVTWNKVHAAHLDAQLADIPPRSGEVHVCNVDGNCAKGRAAR
jgi:multisubunit Na+/H+ antiporter MnhB subunit